MIRLWLAGLLRHRPARLFGAAFGVAVAVALLASLGAFLAGAKASMTARAIASVAVDWQVQVARGADVAQVAAAVGHDGSVRASRVVTFLRVPGLTATTAGSSLRTGSAVLLGLPVDYGAVFPGQLRLLTGSPHGALLAQQTASNLHAVPGSRVRIERPGRPAVTVTVSGVVDLPQANSLFQNVGAAATAQPAAPPDNVVLLPRPQWESLAVPSGTVSSDLVTTQIHVRLDHALPTDPAAAYSTAIGAAHNLEARTAGAAVVGNNLAAALDGARGDAAYAQVLFLFLGLPGAVLAALLTATVASAGAVRRRNEQALLRLRGASARQLLRLVSAEAVVTGGLGCALGLLAAVGIGQVLLGSAAFGATTAQALGWIAFALAVGAAITVAAVVLPARRDVRDLTVAAGRQALTTADLGYPAWARYGLDIAALIGAALVFAVTGRNGYQLVLAPEGVASISVSYWALAGPALLWLGAGLLIWRLVDLLLGRGRRVTSALLRPLGGRTSALLGASMSRRRRPLVRAAVLLALATAFAISTATFNATYRAQAEADAQLTNGADVTVTQSPGATVGPAYARTLARVPGVRAVEALQHRLAYVGADVQDLFGVNPASIGRVTALQDAYFAGGSAAALLHKLAVAPDSILVSAETVKDYQLRLGDLVRLRLVDGRTHTQRTVAFHYVGVVSEFPTAPKDSFFVTNAAYVARQTGSDAVGAFLLDTGGSGQSAVAARVRTVVGGAATVTDIGSVRGKVGSSLTAVDLAGLTRIELLFAVVLAAASSGLVLALGLAERRRSFAVLRAIGAPRRPRRAAIAGEASVIAITGAGAGIVLGGYVTKLLVSVLTGVFDPPPSIIAVPWSYLLGVAAVLLGCLVVVCATAVRLAGRNVLAAVRGL